MIGIDVKVGLADDALGDVGAGIEGGGSGGSTSGTVGTGGTAGGDVELPGDLIDDLSSPGTWIAVWWSHCRQLRDRSHSFFILNDVVSVRHKAPIDCFPGFLPLGWVRKDWLRNARKGVVQNVIDQYGNFLNPTA